MVFVAIGFENAADGERKLWLFAFSGVVGEEEVVEHVLELEQSSEGMVETERIGIDIDAVIDFWLDSANI